METVAEVNVSNNILKSMAALREFFLVFVSESYKQSNVEIHTTDYDLVTSVLAQIVVDVLRLNPETLEYSDDAVKHADFFIEKIKFILNKG